MKQMLRVVLVALSFGWPTLIYADKFDDALDESARKEFEGLPDSFQKLVRQVAAEAKHDPAKLRLLVTGAVNIHKRQIAEMPVPPGQAPQSSGALSERHQDLIQGVWGVDFTVRGELEQIIGRADDFRKNSTALKEASRGMDPQFLDCFRRLGRPLDN